MLFDRVATKFVLKGDGVRGSRSAKGAHFSKNRIHMPVQNEFANILRNIRRNRLPRNVANYSSELAFKKIKIDKTVIIYFTPKEENPEVCRTIKYKQKVADVNK